jgi:autotransporter-associated beta strand protein
MFSKSIYRIHALCAQPLSFASITAIFCLLALAAPSARGQNEFNSNSYDTDWDGATTWKDYDGDGNLLGTYSRLGERAFTSTDYQYRTKNSVTTNGDYTASSNPSTLLYDYNLDVSRGATLNIGHDLSTSATDTNTGQLSVGGEQSGGTINHTAGTLTTGTLRIGDTSTYSNSYTLTSDYHISGTADLNASSILIDRQASSGGKGRGRLLVGDGVTLDESITVKGTGSSSIEGSGTTTGGTLTGQITLETYSATTSPAYFAGDNMTLSGGIVSAANESLAIDGKNYTIDTNAINLNGGTMLFWGADNDKANATQLNVAGNDWGKVHITRGGYLLAGAENVMDSGAALQFGQFSGWSSTGANGSGTFDLNGYDQTVDHIVSNFSGDDQKITDTSGNGATLTVDYSGISMNYYGRFEGDVGLTKEGSGTIKLNNQSGTNSTNTGVIRINDGQLQIYTNDALGSTAGETIIGDGMLSFSYSNMSSAENFSNTVGGSGTVNANQATLSGQFTLVDHWDLGLNLKNSTLSGGFTSLDKNLTISGTSNTIDTVAIDLDSDNSGGAGILKISSATTLNVGGNDWGALQIESGARLFCGADNVLVSDTGVDLSGGGWLDVTDTDQTVSYIAGTGRLSGYPGGTLTINQSVDTEFNGAFTGSTNVTKDGSGTLALNYYSVTDSSAGTTGVITINDGALVVSRNNHLGTTDGETIVGNGAELRIGSYLSIAENITNNGSVSFDLGTYSGSMSGSGYLEKSETGTLTLSGTNTYSGGTTVNAGTLVGTTDSLQGNISNDGTVRFDQSTDGTYSSVMSGSGSLEKAGSGTLTLGGMNTYSGGTTVIAGTLAGTTDNLQMAITNNGNVRFDQSTYGIYSGAMSGSGSLEKAGTGTVELTYALDYSGSTTVNGGTLRMINSASGDGINPNANYTVNSGGTLEFNKTGGSNPGTINLSGDGTFKSTGTGELVQTSAGSTVALGSGALFHVESGIYRFGANGLGSWSSNLSDLQIDSGATFDGAGTPTVVDSLNGAGTLKTGGGITFGADNGDGTFSGNIENSSYGSAKSLTKAGTGTQILNGTTTHTGTTTVNGGTLSLGSGYNHSGGGAFVVNAAGTLEGTTDNLQGATITNDGNVRLNQSTDGTYSDAMSGTGSMEKSGTGTVTLSGTNTYSGGTILNAGALIGTTDSLQGAITNDGTIRFDQSSNGTYSGAMSGSGSLEKSGTGTLTLSGTTTHTGTTTVNGGTLSLGSDHTHSGGGAFVVNAAGTLEGTTDNLQGAAITNDGNVRFNQSTDGTYSDAMSGTGSLEKSGTGTVTLSGTNTYSGGTILSAGTLIGTTDSLQGAITNNGSIRFEQSTEGTYSGAMTGTGSLEKSGTGTLIMTGTNSHSGATTLNAGTLRMVNSASGDGINTNTASAISYSIASGATLEFNRTGGTSAIGKIDLSGEGTFKKTGSEELSHTSADSTVALGSGALFHVESGTYRFGGVTAGTWSSNLSDLQIDSGATFNGAATVIVVDSLNGAGSLKTGGGITVGTDNGDGTFSGNIENSGYGSTFSFTKNGTGTQTLTGTSTYSGGTTVNGGTLAGTTDSLQGAITNDANVRFDQSTEGTYSGAMTGTGSLEKAGTGTVIMTGTNSHSGATTVNAGTLRMVNSASGDGINRNTASARSYSVASGATLEFNRTGGTSAIGKIDLSGEGTFKKSGSEELFHYSADSTVALGSGALFHVESGTYRFGAGTAGTWSSNLSDLQIDSGATFSGAATVIVVDSLNGAGTLKTGGGITVGTDNGDGTFSGNIENSSYGSAKSLTKTGTGTQILTGTNAYTGTTEINDGTLVVNGTNSGGGTMTININGTLAGSGSITGDIDVLGTISPGNSPGTLTQIGDQTWNDGGSFLWEINDSDGTKGADPGWDWLDIDGTLDLSSLTAGGFTIDIDSLTSSNVAGDAVGFDTYIRDGDIADYSFTIASASAGITGFDAADFVLDSSGFSNRIETYYGWNWAISLSGNDLVLGASAVPEPSSTALLGLGGLALAVRRKRS